jgi:hypothetical protein
LRGGGEREPKTLQQKQETKKEETNQLKKEFEILFPEESTAIKQGKTHKHFLYAACIWRGFKAGKTGKVDVEK